MSMFPWIPVNSLAYGLKQSTQITSRHPIYARVQYPDIGVTPLPHVQPERCPLLPQLPYRLQYFEVLTKYRVNENRINY